MFTLVWSMRPRWPIPRWWRYTISVGCRASRATGRSIRRRVGRSRSLDSSSPLAGYPADRPWAPPGSVRELTGPADGVRAVDEAAAYGHDLIKLELHSGAPLLDDATLRAVVRAAHQRRLPVGVHAEGRGQARRAFEAGADILVHVPWTESLPDDLLAAMAGSMRWTSTIPAVLRLGAIPS